MFDSLTELDDRAYEWARSSSAQTLVKFGVGLAVIIWIVFGIVAVQDESGFDSLLVQVLFGASFFAFIFVMPLAFRYVGRFLPDARGKNPKKSALAASLIAGTAAWVVGTLRWSLGTAAVVRAVIFAMLVGAARYMHVRRVNRDQ